MSADEKADLLDRLEHRTTLDRPNFEHFTLPDLRRVVDDFDEGPFGSDGVTIFTDAEFDRVIRYVSRTAIDRADEYRSAQAEFEAEAEADDGRTNANPRYIHDGGADLSAVDRINAGYPPDPELIGSAVEELRTNGRESAARRLIQQYPSVYAVAQSSEDSEDHSDLSPDEIRTNAMGEDSPQKYQDWDDDADLEKLAPSHPWLNRSEWDVKRDDDLDGDE